MGRTVQFRFLGTGSSVGVPQIGCGCPICTSTDPRDRRRRCGAYVTDGESGVLIDTPPEMRLSCCEYGISRVDAVALTHAHMDHVAGFDDVRRFNTINGTTVKCDPADDGANGRTCRVIGKVLPVYAMAETEAQMHRIFPYVSDRGGLHGLYRPQIAFDNADDFSVGKIAFSRIPVEHGFPCCGYLVNRSLAYISDCHVIPTESLERIRGVATLVINCLREREHPTHLKLSETLRYIDLIRPARALLIHMCHDFTHRQWLEKLPPGVEPAYDGQEIEI